MRPSVGFVDNGSTLLRFAYLGLQQLQGRITEVPPMGHRGLTGFEKLCDWREKTVNSGCVRQDPFVPTGFAHRLIDI